VNARLARMYFAYFDETGDTGMDRSPTSVFALNCILLHDSKWLSALDQTIAFRRFLNINFHISPRSELKANWLIHNKGDIKASGLSYIARMAAYKAAMRFQRKCQLLQTFTILLDKSRMKNRESDVRNIAWEYAIQRLERFGTANKDNIHVLPDEGHGEFIRKKIRAMRRFNLVPSAFDDSSLDRKAQNIVEDSSDRRSHESYFIQFADLNAYAAFRRVFPGKNFGVDIYEELGGARLNAVNSLSGGPPGIVVWPK
jgi:hypothetical protein